MLMINERSAMTSSALMSSPPFDFGGKKLPPYVRGLTIAGVI